MAGDLPVQPEQLFAQPQAVRLTDRKAGVADDRAGIRDVVVQALQLEQHGAQHRGGLGNLHACERLDRLAERNRMADGRVARDPFGKRQRLVRQPPVEETLRALVREVQPGAHLEDGLAHHVESEVTGLDHPRMHRPDRDFVDALSLDGREGKRPAVVLEHGRDRVGTKRVKRLGPEPMPHERARVGMAGRLDPEQVAHLALESGRRKRDACQRRHGR